MSRIAFLAILLGVVTAGCGYRSGQIVSGDGASIAVPIFGNRTWRRDVEKDMTRAVAEAIRSRTGYRLTDESAGPDLVLLGEITSVEERVLSERERGVIRESSVAIVVEFHLEDTRTGERTVARTEVSARRSFAPVKGESIRTAEAGVMREIAERIVYTLGAAPGRAE